MVVILLVNQGLQLLLVQVVIPLLLHQVHHNQDLEEQEL